MKLTHFQKTVKRALDLTDGAAGEIQPGWPASSDDLENVLFDWNDTLVKKVPGLQMMAAIPVVWSRKPADHSEAEGFGRLSSGALAINVIIDNAMRLVRGSALEVKLEKCRI